MIYRVGCIQLIFLELILQPRLGTLVSGEENGCDIEDTMVYVLGSPYLQ
jgi:hypothetical protein